jgi:hypothetical protein
MVGSGLGFPPVVGRSIAVSFCLMLTFYSGIGSADERPGGGHFSGTNPRHFDPRPAEYRVGERTYRIPQNRVPHHAMASDRAAKHQSVWAILPDLGGMTRENEHCFLDARDPCHRDVIRIRLNPGWIRPGTNQLATIRGYARKVPQVCGVDALEVGTPDDYRPHRYLFKDFGDGVGTVVARCLTGTKAYPDHGGCDSSENIGDGNFFDYRLDLKHACDWAVIRLKVRALVDGFR